MRGGKLACDLRRVMPLKKARPFGRAFFRSFGAFGRKQGSFHALPAPAVPFPFSAVLQFGQYSFEAAQIPPQPGQAMLSFAPHAAQ